MKFSEQWLRQWVNPKLNTEQLCELLTMAGLEVDSVSPASGQFTDVVVARVDTLKKHPDADKLNICQVTDGKNTQQIVCGASNVKQGLMVALAKVGAELPTKNEGESWKIKPAKLRGIESFGMLCSEKELGLADSAEGLMELPEDAPLGENLATYLALDDNIITLDLTPNRGDCLSIKGIARELAALTQAKLNPQAVNACAINTKENIEIEIEAKEDCSFYAGRVIKNINLKAKTPLWMQERLRRCGIRCLSPIVDVTNYVMLELGQPMHAFDLDKLTGKIIVRLAKQAEKLTLLDGKLITLTKETLVISDEKNALAIAGIMGGENSAVTDTTTNILLESAFFKPEAIAGKARSYGLHTDSSHRFERGVDSQQQINAIERASELIKNICGGEIGVINTQKTASHPNNNLTINLRSAQIKRILGIKISDTKVSELLQNLGMRIDKTDKGWQVSPPSFRFDIKIEADLLEEIARVFGYNNIPRTRASYHGNLCAEKETNNALNILKQCLVERGYYEAISYSFVDPNWQKILDPEAKTIALANPLSSEMSVMRTSLLPGLLSALKHNVNRQQNRVRLFETGLCFKPQEKDSKIDCIEQIPMFSGVICGIMNPEQWAQISQKVDYYDIKADLEALLVLSESNTSFEVAAHPALHPGQSAKIIQQGQVVGYVGALHPSVQKSLAIEPSVFIFEIKQSAINTSKLPAFKPLSRFPEVRRDLAIVVDEKVVVADLLNVINQNASKLVKEVQVFDIYQGEGVEKGRKSIAFSLILQEFSRTLTDKEVDLEIETLVSSLNHQFTATLRE